MSGLEATDNEQFSNREYWEARYANLKEGDDEFDWFKAYADLSTIFDELIPDRTSRILMLGCGNSTLSGDMYAAGYENIINYSQVIIERMKKKHPEQTWIVMDVTALSPSALGGLTSFDVIIDKGTMDALMAEKGSVWSPSPRVVSAVKAQVDGVLKLLKPAAKFLYLTFGQPHFRRPHLERKEWSIETRTIGDMFHYYLYVATKDV